MERSLVESAIVSLLVNIRAGKMNISQMDRQYSKNSNYPSSLDYAKSLLYLVEEASENRIKVPKKPFTSAYEVYDYLEKSIKDFSQSQPKYIKSRRKREKLSDRESLIRVATDPTKLTGPVVVDMHSID
ncbi:hypothetical protein KA107_02085 [Candidatus Pacearchaeota archaeon]|nr:hypothetical protein [Candidatus Pacearchaeota archaeon]